MIVTSEQFDQIIEIQRRQLQVLKCLCEMVVQQLPCEATPHYYYPLEKFKSFDWDSIGAKVERVDEYGPEIVSWWGRQFVRKSVKSKSAETIWFSRCIGVGADGQNQYEQLITFRDIAASEPLQEIKSLLYA